MGLPLGLPQECTFLTLLNRRHSKGVHSARALRPISPPGEKPQFPEAVATPMHGHSLGRVRSPEPRRRKSCRASCFERSCDLQEGSRSARSTLMERQPGNKSPGLTHPTLWPPGGAPLPNPIRSQRGRSTWSKDTKAILPSTECGSGGLMGTYLAYPTSSSVKWAVVRVK